MTTVTPDVIVTGPGVYDLDESRYFADDALHPEMGRSLSVHGAMQLLDHSPYVYRWNRDHPDERKQSGTFDFGKAFHAMVLGAGAELRLIDADSYTTKAARDSRDEAYALGLIPVLNTQRAELEAMRAAVLVHPIAGNIFATGRPEQSLYWIDDETGITCRARLDWTHPKALVDLKSASDSTDDGYPNAAARFGYYEQAEWYMRGWLAVTGERLPFVHVVVENSRPYVVRVLRLDDAAALDWAARRNSAAMRLYAECESADEWPGPDAAENGMASLSLPRWIFRVKDYR